MMPAGIVRETERTRREARAGAQHHGWFGAASATICHYAGPI